MQDRFKFKAVLHQNKYEEYQLEEFSHQRVFDVMSINLGIEYSTIEIIAEYPNGDWAVREIDDKDIDLIQCTGLKDKNGKLIYEGDIVKYAEFDWTDFSFKDWETEIAQVVWGNTYDNYYPAFDLKDTDFDGTNAFAYLFNEGWTIEVIGNIYENKELLEN